MAKVSKNKKEEVVPEIEQPIIESNPEVISEESKEEIAETEKVVEPAPSNKEDSPEAPVMVTETPIEKEKLYEYAKPAPKQEDLSMEEKLMKFLQARGSGYFKVNDFLKSLYPITKFNEQPNWLGQGESKRLRNMLETMRMNGQIKISNDMHRRLGTFHYPDTTTLKTDYYNLNNVPLECSM